MKPHLIKLPRRIVIGRSVISRVPKLCQDLGISGSALIISGKGTVKIGAEKIIQKLGKTSKTHVEEIEQSTMGVVMEIEKKCPDADFVIGCGGGKAIDVGKLIAFEKKVPFISVPTAPSHDGIASDIAIIKKDGKHHSTRTNPPLLLVADIEILKGAPYELIASGAADAISNYSAVYDWKLGKGKGEYYSEYSASLSLLSSKTVMESASLIRKRKGEGIRNLVEALIMSGISMSLVGSSRPASGAEHAFSHALDMLGSGALHGQQCGLGCILMSYLQGQNWEGIKRALLKLGAPTTAREAGIEKEMIIEALVKARDVRDRWTILNEKKLDRKKAEQVCRATGVI